MSLPIFDRDATSIMVIFGNISSSNCQQMRIWQEFKITLSIPTKVVKLKLPGYVQEGKIQIHAKLKTMKEPCLHDSRCSNKWESIENMKPGKLRVETVWAKFSRWIESFEGTYLLAIVFLDTSRVKFWKYGWYPDCAVVALVHCIEFTQNIAVNSSLICS